MQYVILKRGRKNWVTVAIVQSWTSSAHEASLRRVMKEYNLKSGEFWVLPVGHSSFFTVIKGKLMTKEKPWAARWKSGKRNLTKNKK